MCSRPTFFGICHLAKRPILVAMFFRRIVARGLPLTAYSTAEFVKDMGTPDRLAEIERAYRSGRIARLNWANRRKAIFLDRDGVVLNYVDHLTNPDDVELAPGAGEAIRRINDSEQLAVLVTNQPMLAKGMLTRDGLEQIHARMETLLAAEHGAVPGHDLPLSALPRARVRRRSLDLEDRLRMPQAAAGHAAAQRAR